jgi:hypothetical protein
MTVDKEGFRDAGHAIINGNGATCIYDVWISDPICLQKAQYCPYDVLLASLGSLSLDEARRQMQDMWEIAIRPVRRAMNSLKAGLRDFGLQVRSIWSAGYLVEARAAKRA